MNPGGADRSDAKAALTVSQLVHLVRETVRAGLPSTLHVAGEVSNLSRPASGHVYFTLKDADSEVRCVMWRSDATTLRFRPEDGLAVLATGAMDVYEPRGQLQLYVRRLEPRGIGALELAFRQLRDRLAREGLFDQDRKRPLPAFPRTVAVVTSPTGAAIRDVLQTLRRRFPAIRVLVHPARVQGDGAAAEIADAIARLNAQADRLGGVDVLIVGRGGGSLEDLWAFNEEVVARAIFASRIPVVSAVGHEVDFTIADFVADVRAATPTAAAELVVPVLADVLTGIDSHRARLIRAARAVVELARARLSAAERSECFRDPLARIRVRQQAVDEVSHRLHLAMTRRAASLRASLHRHEIALGQIRPDVAIARRRERMARLEHRLHWSQGHANLLAERRLAALAGRLAQAGPQRAVERDRLVLDATAARLARAAANALVLREERLKALATRLNANSHEQVLRRGFSITRRLRGRKIVQSPRDVRVDEKIITQTAQGEIESRVVPRGQGDLFEP